MALTGAAPSSLPKKSKKNTTKPSASTAAASPSTVFANRLAALQQSLSTSTDLNPLADLVNLVQTHADDLNSSAIIPALTLIVRTFTHLIERKSLQPWPAVRATGYLAIDDKPAQDQVVHSWLKERFNEALKLLSGLIATHSKDKTRNAALNALMELQRATTEAGAAATTGGAAWSECPWRLIVGTVLSESVSDELRAMFVQDWVEKYADVKLAFLRSLNTVLSAPTSSGAAPPRSAALSILVAMSNPPAKKVEIKSSDFFVKVFSTAPEASSSTGGKASGPKGKGSKAAAKKRKITQDGDSASGSDDEDDDDGVIYFSDSGEEDETNTVPSRLDGAHSKGDGSSRKRRRGGMASMPFHQALYELKAWRASTEAVWLTLILQASPKSSSVDAQSSATGLSLGQINTILRIMEKRVLPYLSRPQLIADYLLDCLDVGGPTALLSLSPLYSLYISASLSLPTLYTTLYGLLTPSLLHSPHRSHSLRMLSLFLSSEKLSLATVAAFVKRLARCALRGPPGGVIPVVVMTYNLLKNHREGMALLHREMSDDEVPEGGWKDPYEEDDPSCPPSASRAVDSSLFEFVSLGAQPTEPTASTSTSQGSRELESHYHSPTSTLVRMLAQPFTKTGYDLEEFLDHSYATLLSTEVKRTLDESEAATKRRNKAPAPAVRHSVPGSSTRTGPDGKKKTKMPRVFPRTVGGNAGIAGKVAEVVGAETGTARLGAGAYGAAGDGDATMLDPSLAQAQPDDDDAEPHEAAASDDDEEEEDDSVNEDNLDDEEREAREAMREVKREERRRLAREAELARKRKDEEGRLRREMDTMGLGVF
ncbi:hypothetical protein BDZ90DRAFT_273218 [Jaminaea rosea]|uniref:CCAAT-binding factor domain-containing protein n=1 Tax=Jaminaea rosea TaxID=1569628 RepID=A0A316V0G6_9BASI|nr:hypothetical protein BDZ90DRAFT_273218 [Jaminaea rosea]PWN30972.1 hypothetical protein BDZ90DRAFT_273218 [Jaminaea rosea]